MLNIFKVSIEDVRTTPILRGIQLQVIYDNRKRKNKKRKTNIENTETVKLSKYGVFLFRIQPRQGKIRTRKTPYLDTFHAM